MRKFSPEHRLIFLSNTGNWARDVKDEYVTGPYQTGNNIQKLGGPIMTVGSTLLEGPDQIWTDIIKQDIKQPRGIAGRTRRDVGLLVKDVVTLHPIRAASDAFRLAFSDIPLDGGDALFGFRKGDSYRSRMHATLNSTSLAA